MSIVSNKYGGFVKICKEVWVEQQRIKQATKGRKFFIITLFITSKHYDRQPPN